MKKNYKLHKKVTGAGDRCRWGKEIGIPGYNVRNYKTTKGSHGLHQGSLKLQTMTALIKSFYRGVQGGRFFQKESPLAAGGRREEDKNVVLY